MTHPLTYTGIGVDALLDAAKYDPPSADLVKALADALSESLVEWQDEIEELVAYVRELTEEIEELEGDVSRLLEDNELLERKIAKLKTGDTE